MENIDEEKRQIATSSDNSDDSLPEPERRFIPFSSTLQMKKLRNLWIIVHLCLEKGLQKYVLTVH